jgi:hypothetical protein
VRLRTDDDIYRARLVYLGPPGYTLPFQLPYAQYGLFLLLVPVFMFGHWLLTFHVDVFPAWEIALSMVTTSYIFRHVDPDRPARLVIRTALTDWRRTREPAVERRAPRLVASRVRIGELLPGGTAVGPRDRKRRARDTAARPSGRRG